MSTFPATPVPSYPVGRALEFSTVIASGVNATEQRAARTTGEERWVLQYDQITLADRDTLLAAFETAKGNVDQSLDFTFNGTTYSGCFIEAASVQAAERKLGQWSLSLTLRQVRRAADSGALPSDFPALASGNPLQIPYTYQRAFDNVIVRSEGGRFVYYNQATSLRLWFAGGPALTDADAQTIWDMFRRAGGRFKPFAFTDPDSGTRYATCRFADDAIEWHYLGPNVNQVVAKIQQLVS